jgi:hypothetical protein
LVFGPYEPDFAKLFTIDLSGLLTPNPQGQINFQVTIGLTRLPCLGATSCAGGAADWAPQLYLGDGINLFGGEFNDNPQGAYGNETVDQGNTVASPVGGLLYPSALFPAIGDVVEMQLAFLLRPGQSRVTVSAFGQSADFEPSFALDLTGPLALAFVRDNDDGEQYQVNFLQINFPNRAPEPATLSLLGLAIAALGFARRRRDGQVEGSVVGLALSQRAVPTALETADFLEKKKLRPFSSKALDHSLSFLAVAPQVI